MTPKPQIERCTAWVVLPGFAICDGHQCRLSATALRDGHAVCHRHLESVPIRYVAEATAATAGRRVLQGT
jgi:hypothetical protein